MIEDAYDRKIRQQVEWETRLSFRISLARLVLGAGLIAFGVALWLQATLNEDYLLPVLSILLAALVLAGVTFGLGRLAKIGRYLSFHRKSWTRKGTVARANAVYDAVNSLDGDSTALQRLHKKTRIVLWGRMCGLAVIALLIATNLWAERQAHIDRYGTYCAVRGSPDDTGTIIYTPQC